MALFIYLVLFCFAIYLLKSYLGLLVSLVLTRYLRCESVKLQGCKLFLIQNAKFVFKNGISIEIENLRLSSSFISHDHTKPISVTLDDIRIESQSSLSSLQENLVTQGNAEANLISFSDSNNAKKFLHFLQYTGARINCINIVLLEAIPDCLLHISFENLQLESYRDREGFQVEISFKLAQVKLFVRNFHRSVCLVELSLAGLFSVDIAEKKFDIWKFGVVLNNPRISIFDDLFSYLTTHKLKTNVTEKKEISSEPTFSVYHLISVLPNLKFEIDSLTVQFVAVHNSDSTRTLSVSILRSDAEFTSSNQRISMCFNELSVSDHAALSNFKCEKLAAHCVHSLNLENENCKLAASKLDAELNLLNPSLIVHQHDLVWWIGYVRRLRLAQKINNVGVDLLKRNNSESHKFADDFSRDFSTHQIEQVLKQQRSDSVDSLTYNNNQKVSGGGWRKSSLEFCIQLALNNFEGQLKSVDGAAIFVGIELATFVGDNTLEQFEFGVESLWCHWAASLKPDFKLDLSCHRWGTAIAVGGGLAQLSKSTDDVYQLFVQLDECHFEWEESMVMQLIKFVQLLIPLVKSTQQQDLFQVDKRKRFSSHYDYGQSTRSDLWSSVSNNPFNLNNESKKNSKFSKLIVKISAKKLGLFLTARQSIVLAFSIENWRTDLVLPTMNLAMIFENVYIGQVDMKTCDELDCNWWKLASDSSSIKPDMFCGGVDKLLLNLKKNEDGCYELALHGKSSIEFIWSSTVHLIFLETIRTVKCIIGQWCNNVLSKSKFTPTKSAQTIFITAISEFPVEFGFKLPRNHVMRWIVPSIQFKKTENYFNVFAPTFLIEMDLNIILNVEDPMICISPADVIMNLGRQEFRQLHEKTNKVWTWSATSFEIVFPYGYNFASTFEEVINCVKWVKLVHGYKPNSFTVNSPLPSDVRISLKKISIQMNDDPFEIRLQNIYEVMMDEVFERERRRQMLEVKVAQLKKEDPLFPKAKIDALYNSLIKKDGQIYIERIRKIQQQPGRCLVLWLFKDFELHLFADTIFNGKENVVKHILKFNSESQLPADCEFSTLWARAVELDVSEFTIQFRDYSLPYMVGHDVHFWGTLVGAEQLPGDRSIRQQFIKTPSPWGTYCIERNMCPLKFYYDLACEIDELSSIYGPCWEPCLSMISLCWDLVNSPSTDPSDPMPFWDKVRLILHGQFSMMCKKLITSMLASTDPYNDTELIELSWEKFEFDWTSGEFRIQTDLDAFIRTASKYDDSRLLHLPKFKCAVQLDWDCLGDQHDHHSMAPCALNKLPDYSTNVKHDSYRAFRSKNVSIIMRFEAKQLLESLDSDRKCPQILLYANTLKCLDFMNNTLTMVNRPVKRGALFGNKPAKRVQLSTHFKTINLSWTLPRFLISYWMSFSSPFGFRMISDSLHLTTTTVLQVLPAEKNDGITRKTRSRWKIFHMSAQLENAQIHLFGGKRQPTLNKFSYGNNLETFFVGLSRLNYIREWNIHQTHSPLLMLNTQSEDNVVHRLTVHDLKASWTIENRDICLVIAEGVQRAHVLRKILDNEAMKMFQFTYYNNQFGAGGQKSNNFYSQPNNPTPPNRMNSDRNNLSTKNSGSYHNYNILHRTSPNSLDDGEEMLWKLVDEAETKLVAYSEETIEHPTDSLHGVALCSTDDVRLTNWQIDLLNSQLVLKGCDKAGFILVTAARASVTQRFHYPVWRHAQLLLKRSWSAVLSGMQYFAPLVIGENISKEEEFRWLSREVIEEKTLSDSSINDKVNNYSATGEAVGGVVADSISKSNHYSSSAAPSTHSELQLQRVASRCSCQLLFCYYSDTINMEKLEEGDIQIPNINQNEEKTWGHKCEEVDCFTLKHNMLEVSTNSEQYQMIIDIVNNLLLFVDPKKTQSEENRRRLWFKLAKKSKQSVKERIVKMQSELREVVSIVRSLERQSYFLNKEFLNAPGDAELNSGCAQLQSEIDEYKSRQNALIDDLAMMISCFKEKEVEEKAYEYRLKMLQQRNNENEADNCDNFDTQPLIARRFEVCFEDCIWHLTENDGQISLAKIRIRNFLYTRTARIDNSGDHLLEIGMVKMLNLLPNSKYKETLAKLPIESAPENATEKTPSIRIICRELPPVGGISIKEHFEVNIVPMNAQITHRFFQKMMAFFFPGRNIDKEDQQNLDVADDQQSQQGFSLAKRFRGAVNSSFLISSSAATASASSLIGNANLSASNGFGGKASSSSVDYVAIRDDIDKMKERAKKNNMFVYIIIPPVPFIVSYKGSKEKNIEDVDRINFTFPIFEYHDKNWTWLDLALAIKQRCKRIILQQLFTHKVLRKRLFGIERVSVPNIETIDEEEKKMIILGVQTTLEDESKKKRKT